METDQGDRPWPNGTHGLYVGGNRPRWACGLVSRILCGWTGCGCECVRDRQAVSWGAVCLDRPRLRLLLENWGRGDYCRNIRTERCNGHSKPQASHPWV